MRSIARTLVALAPLLLLAGCVCCPGSAEEAGLPARVQLHEHDASHGTPAR